MSLTPALQKRIDKLNQTAPKGTRVVHEETIPFGASLSVERFRLQNGLSVLVCVDKSAPVIAYHTWFRVGSRHERPGKTGLSHLFEHLMFNEVEGLKAGEFDTLMEAAGADTNASTWLDFTQYQQAFPKSQLKLVVDLESRRMNSLVLREPQLDSEKEVVANERRYRVDDDVEGAADEVLWKTAFEKHSYHWPTIGWMADIEGFTTEDCRAFYRAYYSPGNASVIVVGDVDVMKLLTLVAHAYGPLEMTALPLEDVTPEPPQLTERTVELHKPTPTEKLILGYKGPALGDVDHIPLTVLLEILAGGRGSRLYRRLIRQDELASDVRGSVGPHKDPSLIEFFASGRTGVTGEQLLSVIEEELLTLASEPPTEAELARATARAELGLLGSLETADGKASTLGFYETVLGRPGAAFERLRAMQEVSRSDLLRVARRYLTKSSRTTIFIRPNGHDASGDAAELEASA